MPTLASASEGHEYSSEPWCRGSTRHTLKFCRLEAKKKLQSLLIFIGESRVRVLHKQERGRRALGFFQLEMQGGIFQSCWSFTVMGRGGECMIGTGGSPLPRGTFLCRNFGGSIGSTGMSCGVVVR